MDSLSDFRDWANLPPEMVELISKKVKHIVDYIRFRAVCSTWRSVSSCPKQHRLPPQLPWLMLPYNGYQCPKEDGTRFFYDVWESKMRGIYLEETCGMTCCASYRGWLLLVCYKGSAVYLLNPLTRCEIELPPFGIWFDPYMISFGMSKMTFSADPTDPNSLIIVFLEDNWVMSYQFGDPSWKRYCCAIEELEDVTCYNGRLYLLYEGKMVIIQLNKPEHEGILEPELADTESTVGVLRSTYFLDLEPEDAVVELTVILEPELAAVKRRFVEEKSGVYVVGVHPEGEFVLYQFKEQHLKKISADSSDSTAIFYGDYYPCLALSSDDWHSLDGGSLYMEHRRVPDDLKLAAVKYGYHTQFAQMVDGNVMYDWDENQPLCYQAAPAMWFQPSLFLAPAKVVIRVFF